jgi:YhcH/YjgK/YiaL family protein
MITDNIKNFSLYNNLSERINKALLFLNENDFGKIQNGRYDIDGDNVFALVNRYKTKRIEEAVWESHRKYIDVQFVAEGIEKIGYSFLEKMTVNKIYDEIKDIQFLDGVGDFITLEKNNFAILFPSDVHMPGISVNESKEVLKVVVKVKIS